MSDTSSGEVYQEAIHDAIYELEQSQGPYGEYDHAAVDDVLESLRQVVDDD